MADESGIQSAFYLLLILSDDELPQNSHPLLVQQPQQSQRKKTIGSSFLDSVVEAIKISPSSKTSTKVNKARHQTDRQSWFYKGANKLIDLINQVLNDSNCKRNCKRIAILLLSNLYVIHPKVVKSFTGKKTTVQLLENFFTTFQDMQDELIEELEHALNIMYSSKEIINLLKRTKYFKKNSFEYFQMLQRRITFDVGTASDGQVLYEIENTHNFQNVIDLF